MGKEIFIGTSGYSYQHWKKVFYPQDLPSGKWLEFYAQHFNCVELNVTFYRLPKETAFKGWHRRTPQDFRFVVKGSRFIIHIKRLKDCHEPVKLFFDRATLLKEKLLAVLWQLPPSLKCDIKTLENFITLLKSQWPQYRYSFEFRDESWFKEDTYKLLKDNNINLCIADSPTFPIHEIITSDFLYLRFHGGKELYGSQYSKQELKSWHGKAKRWFTGAKLFCAFFNNDAHGFAIKNALTFKELINEKV